MLERLARRLFASVFLSAMIASLLSLVPSLDSGSESVGDVPAFQPTGERRITENNLVGVLSEMPATFRIRRADWQNGSLFLHLSSATKPGEGRMYAELLVVIRRLLVHMDNVERLQLDVTFENAPGWSVTANKKDLQRRDPGMKQAERVPPRQYLEEMFRVRPLSPESG